MTSRRFRLLLGFSLALNLFLGGLIAGALVTGARERERPPSRRMSYLTAAERLDENDAARLRALLTQKAEDTRPRVQALRAARREAEAAMAAPDYRPDAVRAALERARTEEMALRREVDDSVIAFALTLDPDERQAIAPIFRRRGKGGHHRGPDSLDRRGSGDRR